MEGRAAHGSTLQCRIATSSTSKPVEAAELSLCVTFHTHTQKYNVITAPILIASLDLCPPLLLWVF